MTDMDGNAYGYLAIYLDSILQSASAVGRFVDADTRMIAYIRRHLALSAGAHTIQLFARSNALGVDMVGDGCFLHVVELPR